MTDNSPATELLPCPFCGGTEFYVGKDFCEDEPTRWYALHVRCQTCYAKGRNHYQIGWCESEEAAREAWNDRIRAETAKNSGEVVGWFVKIQLWRDDHHRIIWHAQRNEEEAREYAKFHNGEAVQLALATPANSRAKNSGEVITDEQLERSIDAFDANVGKGFRCAMRAAIATLAPPANSRATAWYRGVYQPSTPNGPEEYEVDMVWGEDAPDGDNWLPLYATPANSRAEAIGVKPLEWEEIGSGFYRAKAPLFGNIRVEKYGTRFTVCYSLPGYSDTFTPGDFATAEAAKTAAQADYEQRVRNTLLDNPQLDSRAEAIGECIDAINALHQPDLGMEPYGLADAIAALEDLLQQEGE
jgi:Lar family restriction alleviation protein